MRLELTGECDVSPAGLSLEIDPMRRARLGATAQLGAHADHPLTEIDVAPGEPEDLLDPHHAEHRECEHRPIPRRATVQEPPDLVRGQGPRFALSAPARQLVAMESQTSGSRPGNRDVLRDRTRAAMG